MKTKMPDNQPETEFAPSQPKRQRTPFSGILTLLGEAVNSVSASPVRTFLTMLGTILGVTSFIAIVGLGATANGQIAKGFNELEATHITVQDIGTKDSGLPGYNFPTDAQSRMKKLNGVENAGAYFNILGQGPSTEMFIAKQPQVDGPENAGSSLQVIAAENGLLEAAGAQLANGVLLDNFHNQNRSQVAVLGSIAAQKLGIFSVQLAPTCFIGDRAYTVIGILNQLDSVLPEINTAVIIPVQTGIEQYGLPDSSSPAKMLVQTKLGAAKLISVQAPYALAPQKPSLLLGNPPPDWSKATAGAVDSTNSLLLLLSFLALLIGGIAITNTTLVSVMERTGEIGLRLALGAQSIHICLQFLLESAILGAIGAVLGNSAGILVVVSASIFQQWTPVIDPLYLLLAPLMGIAIGVAAGLYPALKATKISPVAALSGGV